MFFRLFNKVCRSTKACDHLSEHLGGFTALQRFGCHLQAVRDVGGNTAYRQHLCCQGQRDIIDPLFLMLTCKEINRLMHFKRIADRITKNLFHIGQKRYGRHTVTGCHFGDALRKFTRPVIFIHERTGTEFDIHNQGIKACGKLFGQNRRCNQRNTFDRRGDIANAIKPFVRWCQICGLPNDRTPYFTGNLGKLFECWGRAIARN